MDRRLTRRGFLKGTAILGGASALGGCVAGGSGGQEQSGLTLQSSFSDELPRKAMEALVDGYTEQEVTLNTVAVESFRAQLPSYLNSANPPDVLTWYAGSVSRDYARKGFLLDVSDLWTGDGACAGFSDALRELSTDDKGRQIFVPISYYWWGVFYRKSNFQRWGVTPPETWEEFLALCKTLQGRDVAPLTMGTGATPWMSSGYFDYLNLRINGPEFHLELLAGEHSFDSPEVREVMEAYRQILPFLDPRGRSYSWQDAVTPLVQGQAGMYLIGAFFTTAVPADARDDLDFFRFPIIDPKVPIAEEAPTDGFFASAKTDDPEGAKDLMGYFAEPGQQQTYIEVAQSSNLPTSPEVDTSGFSPMVQKGITFLQETPELTQFFNRDSSDELQTTADTALTRFLDNPDQVDTILREWQAAAEKVWQG